MKTDEDKMLPLKIAGTIVTCVGAIWMFSAFFSSGSGGGAEGAIVVFVVGLVMFSIARMSKDSR